MLGTSGLAVMAFERGQLHLAWEIATPVINRIEQFGSLPPISAVIYGVLGEVYYQWVQMEPAQRYARRTLQLSTLGGYQSGIISCRVLLSRLSQLAGDLASAAHKIQVAVDQLQVDTPDYVRQEAISQQVRLCLAQNRHAAAALALQRQGFSFQDQFAFPDFPSGPGISHAWGLLCNSGLRFLLFMAGNGRHPNKLNAGLELADRLIPAALQGQKIPVALEAYLLRAQMHAALGKHQASQADYARALELAEPEGFIGVFIEQGPRVAEALSRLDTNNLPESVPPGFVKRILDAFTRWQPPDAARQASSLVEPLSERELDVLRLMAAGLKYKEIAARLFISLNTVRYHVKALYGKLNVNNRTQAITVARRQEIL
jgi:LuxR family maltose regulon positive regulatory protein